MRSLEVDGNDVLAVYQAAHELVEAARQGQGPATLICNTFRYGGHHSGEPGTAYRSKEEIADWKAKDPLPRFEKVLLEPSGHCPGGYRGHARGGPETRAGFRNDRPGRQPSPILVK